MNDAASTLPAPASEAPAAAPTVEMNCRRDSPSSLSGFFWLASMTRSFPGAAFVGCLPIPPSANKITLHILTGICQRSNHLRLTAGLSSDKPRKTTDETEKQLPVTLQVDSRSGRSATRTIQRRCGALRVILQRLQEGPHPGSSVTLSTPFESWSAGVERPGSPSRSWLARWDVTILYTLEPLRYSRLIAGLTACSGDPGLSLILSRTLFPSRRALIRTVFATDRESLKTVLATAN